MARQSKPGPSGYKHPDQLFYADDGHHAKTGDILNLRALDAIKVSLPFERHWEWRTLAYKLAVRIHMQRKILGYDKLPRIGEDDSVAAITMYINLKCPRHFDEARAQRARIGLESPSTLLGLDYVNAVKLATAAATGRFLSSRRKLYPPYAVKGKRSIRHGIVNFMYSDHDFIWLEIRRVRQEVTGEGPVDRYNDEALQMEHVQAAEKAEEERRMRQEEHARQKELEEAIRLRERGPTRKEKSSERKKAWAQRGGNAAPPPPG